MAVRTCAANDLRVVQAEGDGAGGRQFVYVDVRNDGSAPCVLHGRTRVTAAGAAVPVTTADCCGIRSTSAAPVTLAVGGLAHLALEADNQLCRDDATAVAHVYRHLALGWGRTTLSLDGDEDTDRADAELRSCTGTLSVTPWHS